ncbi:MAG: organomercurial lyase [Ilumatobacter sp.]|uniref:organomercurial lyase n=1 Tax=Ilumatobacter sp. TaxID=1967498 RepID=UPI00261C17B8|nr:organomercurial lyase [Ilumatobacter sp.]MDJ0771731.1 organomercurial lyase [Ilumatobacter sp.]
MPLDDTDWELRRTIYAGLAATGMVPSRSVLAAAAGGFETLDRRLRALDDHHQVVLDADGSIRMALPFSAIPTDHVVRSGDRRWFANCAWDSLAIPAALGVDTEIQAP